MNTNTVKEGVLTVRSAGVGTVSRAMVRERAVELASIDGRPPQDVSKTDWEQAKREMTGEPEGDPREVVLEAAPESERWDPVHGSTGNKVSVPPSANEDEEGRSDQERLVEEGVVGATQDHMLQASKEAAKDLR